MKKLSICCLLSILSASMVFSQTYETKEGKSLLLKKPLQLSDKQQVKKTVQFILQYYGESFKYFNELRNGKYRLDTNTKTAQEYTLGVISESDGKVTDRIKLRKVKNRNGIYDLILEQREIERFIDKTKLNAGQHFYSSPSTVQIVERDKILWDQKILYDPNIPEKEQRILNRTFTRKYIVDQDDEPLDLFRLCQAGRIVPYNYGQNSKVLTIDNEWHSIIYFDKDVTYQKDIPVNGCFGSYGLSNGYFMNPTGIAVGREEQSGNYLIYPVYIADQYNARLVCVNFIINQLDPELAHFDKKSFTSLNDTMFFPFDVAFIEPPCAAPRKVCDKIWVSEASPNRPTLACLNTDGGVLQRFRGYFDANTGTIYLFEPGTKPRISVYSGTDGGFNALSVTDNQRNCLVSCLLRGDGTGEVMPYWDGYLIKANSILSFPKEAVIASVFFQRTSEATRGFPYIWVTSGSMIHCVKMNSNGETEYLGSTSLPHNSWLSFSKLMNTMSANDYYDIFTIEQWNYQYGIRQYYPYADVHSDSIVTYCDRDTVNVKLCATFTNECNVQFTAERKKNDKGWEQVIIKRINGEKYNLLNPVLFRLAGNTESNPGRNLVFQLELPFQDYLIGGRVRLHSKIFPEYADTNYDGEIRTRDYETDVKRSCMPTAGGCPFIYVLDSDSAFKVDNNILHRWEFSDGGASDIQDLYRLQIKPKVFNGYIIISIAENESDHSYFDQVKLYAVDYPDGNVLGVTENNDIVLYDPSTVISADTATLNGSAITSLIQYNYPIGVNTVIDDSIYAHYPILSTAKLQKSRKTVTEKERDIKRRPNKMTNAPSRLGDSVAIIASIGNLDTLIPNSRKYWGGHLTAADILFNISERKFARREKPAEVIIPLFSLLILPDYINHIGLKIQNDSRINYLATVNVSHPSLTMNEAVLDEAARITLSGTKDILSYLQNIDQSYAELDSASMLTLKFKAGSLPPVPSGYQRAYLFEVVGHYDVSNPGAKNAYLIANNVPLTNQLYHNYPNPFNPLTRIKFDINKDNFVKVRICNILGQEVSVLVNEFRKAGSYMVQFDGSTFASGVYFYRIEAGDFIDAKKMILVK